jgi:lipopolysaccharide transport system ATP-binding protein
MNTVISVENLSKAYQLGQIGTGTLSHDLNVWWARRRGKPNPMLRLGETVHGNRDGEELWALRDVSFTVEQGEVLGIICRKVAGVKDGRTIEAWGTVRPSALTLR